MQEQRRGGKQLRRGARLEGIGKGGSPDGGDAGSSPLTRGQRQQLSVDRIEEDDVAPLGSHFSQRIVQPPLGNLLQLRVEGEHHIVSGHRLANETGRRVIASAGAVFQEYRLSRLPGENRVER